MIKHILFDLDCTLYSVSHGLTEYVSRRLNEYLAGYLGISIEEAAAERKKQFQLHGYGTTLEWLIVERGFTATTEYLTYVHPEDEADSLPPDPQLRSFIEGLPCPSSILTNAPGFHADRIIRKLGLEGIFRQVFDIESNAFRGKPNASAFQRALDALALKPQEVLFVDDIPSYVKGYLALGGRGILFDERDIYADYPHERINNLREIRHILNIL